MTTARKLTCSISNDPRLIVRLIVVAVILVAQTALAYPPSAQVDEAMTSAKGWLYDHQLPDGTWEAPNVPDPKVPWGYQARQFGGVTALVTYAMLACGQSSQEPRLAKSIEFLKKADVTGTYALSWTSRPYISRRIRWKDSRSATSPAPVRSNWMTQRRSSCTRSSVEAARF
jgi:hypothetical protein